MIAEYAAVAGAPLPDTPWPLVLMLSERSAQFEARRQLTAFDAVRSAIGAAMGGDQVEIEKQRDKLMEQAYPSAPLATFAPNAFEAADG